jgi:DegV family protein with EDD domain
MRRRGAPSTAGPAALADQRGQEEGNEEEGRAARPGSGTVQRIVTDSNSQLPGELRDRYAIEVVPITVSVNGTEYREGVDLDADAFYGFWAAGQPDVSTSQPSPGAFVEVYERLVADGASEILSVHVSAALSGTLNSARIAAEHVDVPIRFVDTGTMSFGISCCVWEAAEALRTGASLEQAAVTAEKLAPAIGSVTILQALEFTRAQGRMVDELPEDVEGIPVLAMVDGGTEVVGEGRSIDALSRLMVDRMTASGEPVRVALCIADASARPFYEAMERLLDDRPNVVDLVRYRVGPSVGAFTGPGAAGGFWYGI